jgi:hypothetical protein
MPGTVDVEGIEVSRPQKRHLFRPTFPIESYLTQPLLRRCAALDEMRAFLATCRYDRDKKLHDLDDYWAPPEEFERTRQGDCDCAAIWAWRQLVDGGYQCRFVLGFTGAAQMYHAWVFVRLADGWYALEPFAARGGKSFPKLHTLWYRPRMSASWDGERVHYFEHANQPVKIPASLLLALAGEAIAYRPRIYLKWAFRRAWSLTLQTCRWLRCPSARRQVGPFDLPPPIPDSRLLRPR